MPSTTGAEWPSSAIPSAEPSTEPLRDRGHSHGRALRSIADRLLAIACAMLRNGTLYDPAYKNR